MARAALLDRVAIPAGNVHRMRGEDPPEAAAEAYAADLRNALGDDGRLDLVLLGLAPDADAADDQRGAPRRLPGVGSGQGGHPASGAARAAATGRAAGPGHSPGGAARLVADRRRRGGAIKAVRV